MNTRTAARMDGCDGDGYTAEEHRMAACYLWRKRHFPGDGRLLAAERHPAIVDRRTSLTASIAELLEVAG